MKTLLTLFISLFCICTSWATNIEVVHLGDSLTAGDFGGSMKNFYQSEYGDGHFVVIGSCGASPESYLKSYRVYYTRCGYRAHTPEGNLLRDWVNGKAPQATATPKLEDLIAKYHPAYLVVQLGTNWMDGFSESRDKAIIEKFIQIAKNGDCHIIWITPPDSLHYSKSVQAGVKKVIVEASAKYNFPYIDSTKVTHYTNKSGSDGIHYNTREARKWAADILPDLKNGLK